MDFTYLTLTLATVAVAGYGLATAVWQLMLASLDWLISIGLMPLSFALTGPVSSAIGAQATLIGVGVLGGIVTFAALLLPGMRDVEAAGRLAPQQTG